MTSATLLLVDDHPQVLQVRKKALESRGYGVVTATNAASAISVLENNNIAAVLVEYKFEGVDAEAVASRIKARYPSEPILLLSAYSGMPERILWLVDEYVLRSDGLEKLVDAITRVTAPEKYKETRKPPVPVRQPLASDHGSVA